MECVSHFGKYLILIFSIIIGIGGIALVAVGVVYYVLYEKDVNPFAGSFSVGIAAIVAGAVILFISGLGICGTLHRNTWLLTTYAIILLVVCALQLAAGLLILIKFLNQDTFYDEISDLLVDLFNTPAMHNIEIRCGCCGVNGQDDYNLTTNGYPRSCCPKQLSPCFHPYEIGCADAFTDVVNDYVIVFGSVFLGFALVELTAAIFSFLIRQGNIRHDYRIDRKKKVESAA